MKKLLLIAVPILLSFLLILPNLPKGNVSGEVIHVSADDLMYDTIDNGFYEIKIPKASWKYKSDNNIKVIFGRYDDLGNSGIIAYIIKEVEYPFEVDFGNDTFQQAFLSAVKTGFNETEVLKLEGEKEKIELILKYFDSGLNQSAIYADISFTCGSKLVKFSTKVMDTHAEQLTSLNSDITSGFECKISSG